MGRYAGRFVVDTHCHAQRAAVRFAERGVTAPTTRDMYAGVADVTWFDNSGRLLYDSGCAQAAVRHRLGREQESLAIADRTSFA